MNELTEALAKLDIADQGLDQSELVRVFSETGVAYSGTLVKRITEAYKLFRCNRCAAYFGGWAELRKHLRKEKHCIDPNELRVRKEALLRRVYPAVCRSARCLG